MTGREFSCVHCCHNVHAASLPQALLRQHCTQAGGSSLGLKRATPPPVVSSSIKGGTLG